MLVLTYNTNLDKLFLTLQSIMQQEFNEFEIIVSDDGSADNKYTEIEAYFKKNDFSNYRLVDNKQNQGTVKNILSGLQHVTGKYVKLIGAGDTFYDEHVMEKVYEFMEQNEYECCFGLIQGYQVDQQKKVEKLPYWHPFDIEAYRKNGKEDRITKNLVLYSDNICGAAICYRKDFCIEYMNRIQQEVLYEEDIFQVLSAVEGRPIHLYDNYMIWYEIGEGVSTKKRSKFEELLRQDVERFYGMLYKQHQDNKYVKKRHRLVPFYKIKNLYLRTLLRFFANPHAIVYLAGTTIQKLKKVHVPKNVQVGFLDRDDFWQSI